MRPLFRRQRCLVLAATSIVSFATIAQASVEITAGATKNMSCSAGVCSPTVKKAVLNVSDLTNMLATGDVKITTGAGAVTITVMSPFSWTSTSRLTLDAYYNVSFRAPVTVAGAGAVTIVTNDGGSGGDLLFFPGAKLDFWDTSSNLIVNQTSFALVNSIKGLAADVKTNPSGSYALANDYDAAVDGTYEHTPVKQFGGMFEGNGHAISNLTINAGTRAGFFGAISGTVRDISLANANVKASKYRNPVAAGLLAVGNNGIVENASASGSVQGISSGKGGVSYVGGLVAVNAGIIANSSTAATVFGADNTCAGGLVGDSLGGFSVVESYAIGSVSGGNKSVVGGLAGQAFTVTDSYATALVSAGGHSRAGGLIGQGGDQTSRTYSTGTVSSGRSLVGGFIGYDYKAGDLSDAYWDLDTSGVKNPAKGCGNIQNCPGVVGLTDAQLKSGLPAGFDPNIWGQKKSINNGYPYLLANPPPP